MFVLFLVHCLTLVEHFHAEQERGSTCGTAGMCGMTNNLHLCLYIPAAPLSFYMKIRKTTIWTHSNNIMNSRLPVNVPPKGYGQDFF